MKLEYEIKEEDYYEAHQLTVKSLSRFNRQWIVFAIGVVAILIGSIGLFDFGFDWVMLGAILVGIVLAACPWRIRRKVRSIYAKAPVFQSKIVAEVDERGVRMSTRLGSGECQWGGFEKYAEGSGVFALITPTRVFHIIPKRDLAPDQVQSLRAVIAAHLRTK